jgi:hypothetical protein
MPELPSRTVTSLFSDILNPDPDNLSFGYERLGAMRVGAIHGSRCA